MSSYILRQHIKSCLKFGIRQLLSLRIAPILRNLIPLIVTRILYYVRSQERDILKSIG